MEAITLKAAKTRSHKGKVPAAVIQAYADTVSAARHVNCLTPGCAPDDSDKDTLVLMKGDAGHLYLLRFSHKRKQVQFFDTQNAVGVKDVARTVADMYPRAESYAIVDGAPDVTVPPHECALWCAWKMGSLGNIVHDTEFRPLLFRQELADKYVLAQTGTGESLIDMRDAMLEVRPMHELSTVLKGARRGLVNNANAGEFARHVKAGTCGMDYVHVKGPLDPNHCVELHAACRVSKPGISTLVIENVRDPGALFGLSLLALKATEIKLVHCHPNVTFYLNACQGDKTLFVEDMDVTCLASTLIDPDLYLKTLVIDGCQGSVISDVNFAQAIGKNNIGALFVPESWIPRLTDAIEKVAFYRQDTRLDVASDLNVIRPLPGSPSRPFAT